MTALDRIDRPVIIFTGNFGSGKSEVAVNTAFALAAEGQEVTIVDVDVVNPYFRCREARRDLEKAGIRVVAPSGEYEWADLPIILPGIRGSLREGRGTVILDVGGDDLGAKALASFKDELRPGSYHFAMVHNASRPFTSDLSSSLDTIDRIEASAGIKMTALVGNTHLMQLTTPQTVADGVALSRKVAAERKLSVLFIAVAGRLVADVSRDIDDIPLLPLTRRLRPPWLNQDTTPRPGKPWGKSPGV